MERKPSAWVTQKHNWSRYVDEASRAAERSPGNCLFPQIATRMKDMEDILKMHKDLYQAQGSAKGKPEEAPT